MANSYFQFKQFTVRQDKCAMKVGTDGVLLGAWSDVSSAKRILDIGTGTGLVALMLAQRSEAMIEAIEIDENAVLQARENVAASPWKNRIQVIQADFRTYRSEGKFDVIVSNPPYFVNSLLPPDSQRSIARHNGVLTYYELLQNASKLLADLGKLTLILPTDAIEGVKSMAQEFKLIPSKQLNIITAPGKQPKRSLITFDFISQSLEIKEMMIEKERHVYSEEYASLVKDFYLKL